MINATDILHGRILIVDDQPANVLLLERMLRTAGYDCIESTTEPDKVCELHLLNHYDLILLDLQMPRMDGFQVMENLKQIETGSYLPVLVITAQPNHKLRALRAGAKDFVSKPFDLTEVLLRVHNMLEVRLLHQETRTLYEQMLAEQKVAERRLLEALPQSIAEGLKRLPEADNPAGLINASYAELTLLFADVMQFARFTEGASAEVLRGVLTDISDRFDIITGARSPRSETISDAGLAAMGLPDAVAIHSIDAAHKALDLIEAIDRFNGHSPHKLILRIGLDDDETATRGTQKNDSFDFGPWRPGAAGPRPASR